MDFLSIDDDVVQQEEKDTTGGRVVFESGIEEMVIKVAYFDKSPSGANNLTILFETPDGKAFKLTEYLTSAKGLNYYIDKKDGKTKRPMVGLTKMNGLSNLIKGTPLSKQVIEDKVQKIWDATQSKEVNQTRKTLTEWTGQTVHLGMKKVIQNKSVKNTSWVAGMPNKEKYLPTAETMETNEVDKFFDKDKATGPELEAGTPPAFYEDWLKVHEGKTKDKTNKSIKSGAPSSVATEALSFDD